MKNKKSLMTNEIREAFNHLLFFFPTLYKVKYNGDGWCYMDKKGEAFNFDDFPIDQGILEEAYDSINENITFTINMI